MPVIVFRHSATCTIGLLGDALDARKIEWRYAREDEPGPECALAVVSLGGTMSVNDPLPALRAEERYLTRAISSGVPVLGICLGAQLLAKCLGAKVSAMPRKEIGWYPVRLTDCGQADPLFSGLVRSGLVFSGLDREETVFQWHGDTFELPAGAERLASSDLCANQAFRHGANLYGFQFHPEVTPEIITWWCEEDSRCGDLREAAEPIDPHAHRARVELIAAHIFARWCESFT